MRHVPPAVVEGCQRNDHGAMPSRHATEPSRTRALALATFAFGASFYAWSLLGPLSPDLQKHLDLSEFQTSVMVAVPVLLGSLLRVPLGLLTDRYGGRRVFTALLSFTVIPAVGLALFHDTLTAVVALGLLLGVAGASFAVGVPYLNRWFPAERQGFALGVYGMGMGGTVVGAVTAPRIADAWGLAAPFWVAAGLIALTAVIWWSLARNPPVSPPAQKVRLFGQLAIFRQSSRAWALTLFYFLSFGGFVALFLFLPKLLTGFHHHPTSDAGLRAAGFALFAVLARPVGGWLSDRVGAERVLRAAFTATALLAILLAATYESMVPFTIGCLSIAVAFGLGTGAVFKLVAQWFPGHVGAVTGVVGAAGGLGGFFPPLVMAAVKGATGSYVLGFVLLGATAGIALAVLTAIVRSDAPRSRPKRPQRRREPALSAR
jgi:NNP family nitrate/nitrite transporter-like MFS transporter